MSPDAIGAALLACMLLTVIVAAVAELACPAPNDWSDPAPGSPEAVADGLLLDAAELPGVWVLVPQLRVVLCRSEGRRKPWRLVLDGRELLCPDAAAVRRALVDHLRHRADRGAVAPGGAA